MHAREADMKLFLMSHPLFFGQDRFFYFFIKLIVTSSVNEYYWSNNFRNRHSSLNDNVTTIKQTTVNRYAIRWKAGQGMNRLKKLLANQLFALLHSLLDVTFAHIVFNI